MEQVFNAPESLSRPCFFLNEVLCNFIAITLTYWYVEPLTWPLTGCSWISSLPSLMPPCNTLIMNLWGSVLWSHGAKLPIIKYASQNTKFHIHLCQGQPFITFRDGTLSLVSLFPILLASEKFLRPKRSTFIFPSFLWTAAFILLTSKPFTEILLEAACGSKHQAREKHQVRKPLIGQQS